MLSDEKAREKYDKMGLDGVADDMPMMDPGAFFTMVFGNDKFEHIVGELKIASMMASACPVCHLVSQLELGWKAKGQLAGVFAAPNLGPHTALCELTGLAPSHRLAAWMISTLLTRAAMTP